MSANPQSPPSLRKGHYLYFRGVEFQIESIDAREMTLVARNVVTHAQTTLDMHDLYVSEDDPQDQAVVASSLEDLHSLIEQKRNRSDLRAVNTIDLAEGLVRQAQKIIDVVEAIEISLGEAERRALARGEKFRKTPELKRLLKLLSVPVSLSSYYEYKATYDRESGNLGMIAESLRRSSFNQTMVQPAALHLIDTLIERYYVGPRGLSKSKLYQATLSIARENGGFWVDPTHCPDGVPEALVEMLLDDKIPIAHLMENPDYRDLLTEVALPSRSWVYGHVRQYDYANGTNGEGGIVAVYDTFVATAAYPLHHVFIDHCELDIFVLDDEDNPQKLVITMFCDGYSRSVLGRYISDHSPSIESIQSALLDCIWPKDVGELYGINDAWPAYGIPVTLSMDNAWAHHSHSVEQLAQSLSMKGEYTAMQLLFRRPYNPTDGGLIERYFRGLHAALKMLPGAIRDKSHDGYRQAKKSARLYAEDVHRYVTEVIVRYQNTPHSAINMTPNEKWTMGIEQMGLPFVPKRTPEIERMFWRMHHQTRTIRDQGFGLFGMHYWSSDVAALPHIDDQGRPIEYSIRYERQDISRIAIFRDGRWVCDAFAKELRLADGSTRSVSTFEMNAARRQARGTDFNWLEFLNGWDGIVKEREAEHRQRKRQSQKAQTPPSAPPAPPALSEAESMSQKGDLLRRFTSNTRDSYRNN